MHIKIKQEHRKLHRILGRPKEEIVKNRGNTIFQYFDKGIIILDKGKVFSLSGKIYRKWVFLGKEKSFLGYPTAEIADKVDAIDAVSIFEHGAIYDAPSYMPNDDDFVVTKPIPLYRPQDMVALMVQFINMEPDVEGKNFKQISGSSNAYIILHFPQQSIAEEAFFEKANEIKEDDFKSSNPNDKNENDSLEAPPVKSLISGFSRLSFKVPKGKTVPFTLEGILGKCKQYDLSVNVRAKPPSEDEFENDTLSGTILSGLVAVPFEESFSAGKNAKNIIKLHRRRIASKRSGHIGAGQVSTGNISEITDILHGQTMSILNPVAKPKLFETSIEAPFRLIISPNNHARWSHSTLPQKSNSRTELWHTKLSSHPNYEKLPEYQKIRALYALDLGFKSDILDGIPKHYDLDSISPDNPFRMSLDAFDRANIVHLSSNFHLKDENNKKYHPRSIQADKLMLSSLGSWMNFDAAWGTRPKELSVEAWKHRAVMARDHYVKVVYAGCLFPFGHRASLVKVTERKFHSEKKGNTAYLRRRMYIIIKERIISYDDLGTESLREMPFQSIEMVTDVTPSLNNPDFSQVGEHGQLAFWPRVSSKELEGIDFQFSVIARDMDGQKIEFTIPLIFVDQSIIDEETIEEIKEDYNDSDNDTRKAEINGQSIIYADYSTPGDTTFETESIRFKANSEGISFSPAIEEAKITVPSIKQLTGETSSTSAKYNDKYIKNDFDDGEVFLDFNKELNLDFDKSEGKSGGLIKPNMNVQSLSRKIGLVGGSQGGTQDLDEIEPKDFFGSDDNGPKLFGVFNLFEILDKFNMDKAPKFVTETMDEIEDFIKMLVVLKSIIDDSENPEGFVTLFLDFLNKRNIIKVLVDFIDTKIDNESLSTIFDTLENDEMESFLLSLGSVSNLTNADNIKKVINSISQENIKSIIGSNKDYLKAVFAKLDDEIINQIINRLNPDASLETLEEKINFILDVDEHLNACIEDLSLYVIEDLLDTFLNTGSIEDYIAKVITAQIDDIEGKLGVFDDFSPEKIEIFLDNDPKNALKLLNKLLQNIDDTRVKKIQAIIKKLMAVMETAEKITNIIKLLKAFDNAKEMIQQQTIKLDWEPPLKAYPPEDSSTGSIFVPDLENPTMLISVEMRTKSVGDQKAGVDILCCMENFKINLIGTEAQFLILEFGKVQFSAEAGKKPEIDVIFDNLEFAGPLSFVNVLQDLIPFDGFSDPPNVEVTKKGIEGGFSIAIPGITVGVFSLQNITLGASFTIPFIGDPLSVSFNFCNRENPFVMTIYVFGGGGYFNMSVSPQGVQIIEAAFEFGICFAMSFGSVAHGGVKAVGGFGFTYYAAEDEVKLEGYFHIAGQVEVLRVISVSIELALTLTYFESKLSGEAMISMEVEVACFSKSVEISCHREFTNGDSDPTFVDMMDQDEWKKYCIAFA